mgnify:FL=1
MNAELLVKKLKKRSESIAVAESLTGGGLGQAITSIKGASDVFIGGVIAYSDEIKVKELGVSKSTLKRETAVSEEVAIEMASGIRKKYNSTYGISTTGVAGPGKAYGQKAGTVWIGISSANNTYAIPLLLTGDRETIRKATIESALALLSRILTP